ncbi:hypothetical protein CSQ89_10005 [Chitinimonas sp. BJB300]|nr:hypothetical protein CSQ89_10005 [Chitinimonas sp. BJB300]
MFSPMTLARRLPASTAPGKAVPLAPTNPLRSQLASVQGLQRISNTALTTPTEGTTTPVYAASSTVFLLPRSNPQAPCRNP